MSKMSYDYCTEEVLDDMLNTKVVSLHDIYKIIAGHSYYHGDHILAALTCIAEGKEVNSVRPADVAPVVHGRWDGDNCTACKLPWNYNMTQDADDWGYFDPMPDYCPNCGARMDGDENG